MEATTVTLPDDTRVTCCPDCEEHARAVADQDAGSTTSSIDRQRTSCDGCGQSVLDGELEELIVADGTVLACCSNCVSEASDRDDVERRSASETTAGAESDPGETTATSERSDDHRLRSEESDGRCSQCHDLVFVERFRVTTVDGRTENLCPSCKDAAERDGIVRSVAMRKTKAREVLGVEPDATAAEIHRAYRKQVKRAHPDRKSGSRSAFQLVTEAYERLRDDH